MKDLERGDLIPTQPRYLPRDVSNQHGARKCVIFTLFRCFLWSKWVQEDLWISLCKAWVWFQLPCHPERADSSHRAAAPRNTCRGWESSELFSELGGVVPWGPTWWKRCLTETKLSKRLSKNWILPLPCRLQSKQTTKTEISRGK